MATQRVPITSNMDQTIREHLLFALRGDGAHIDFDTAIRSVPEALRTKRPNGAEHSPWEVLEHLRIAQWDILAFIRDPKHTSPDFPSGYWPKPASEPAGTAWDQSIDNFRRDFAAIEAMVNNPTCDILAPLHGIEGQTIARKLLMLADHNAYHLGELVLLRRILGGW